MPIAAIIFFSGLACAVGVLIVMVVNLHRSPQRLTWLHTLLAPASLALFASGLLLIVLEPPPRSAYRLLHQLGIGADSLDVLQRNLAAGSWDVVIQQLERSPALTAQLLIGIVAAILIIGGLIVWLLSRRATGRWNVNHAPGLLTVGVGVLLLLVPMSVRATAGIIRGMDDAAQEAQVDLPTVTSAFEVAQFVTNTPAPVAVAAVPLVERPAIVLTPLPTRFVYATPVPSPTPVVTVQCRATTRNNLNFRAEPGLDQAILATIPHRTPVSLAAQSADGAWLYGTYGGDWGWLSAAYVTLAADCSPLPMRTD